MNRDYLIRYNKHHDGGPVRWLVEDQVAGTQYMVKSITFIGCPCQTHNDEARTLYSIWTIGHLTIEDGHATIEHGRAEKEP